MDWLSQVWSRIKDLWVKISQKISLGGELVWVLLGGALGGALAPAVVLILKSDTQNPAKLGSLWNWIGSSDSSSNMVMGAIAAGITVYVVSKREGDPKKALFFFSVICGLTFQTILTAVTNPNSQSESAIKKSEVGAEIAQAPKNVAEANTAANVAADAVSDAPASQVDAATRAAVSTNVQKTIAGLEQAQQTASGADRAQFEIAIEKIQGAAQKAGYGEVAAESEPTQEAKN
jgi:hypothetical protein